MIGGSDIREMERRARAHADRARITIACARTVLTEAQRVTPADPAATAHVMGRLETTVEQLIALIEADHTRPAEGA